MTVTLLVLVAFLAYANGSNDNSKGVATLVGYGAARPLQALIYATIATAIGAGISFWFAGGLLKSFSTGLFVKGTALNAAFFVSVLIGAFGWVIFATFTGLPVSTTHAITGALIGAGVVAFRGSAVQWQVLGKSFVLPLVLSPILSLALVYLLAWPVVWLVSLNVARREHSPPLPPGEGWGKEMSEVPLLRPSPRPARGQSPNPIASPGGREGRSEGTSLEHNDNAAVGVLEADAGNPTIPTSPAANAIHWASGGLISFARGWNDAPKIAALSLIALPGRMDVGFLIVAVAMALGGLISGRKVLETLARKLTPLPLPESITASLTTAGLVCLASWNGLPVSTTHVSTGAIIGAGLKNNPASVRWKKVIEVVLSWVITLPVAALLAAAAEFLLRR